MVATWCDALSRGLPFTVIGDGSVERDFLFAEDAAVATVKAAFATEGPAIYNVGSGRSQSLREILEMLGQVSGLSPEVRLVPAAPNRRPCYPARLITTEGGDWVERKHGLFRRARGIVGMGPEAELGCCGPGRVQRSTAADEHR